MFLRLKSTGNSQIDDTFFELQVHLLPTFTLLHLIRQRAIYNITGGFLRRGDLGAVLFPATCPLFGTFFLDRYYLSFLFLPSKCRKQESYGEFRPVLYSRNFYLSIDIDPVFPRIRGDYVSP